MSEYELLSIVLKIILIVITLVIAVMNAKK